MTTPPQDNYPIDTTHGDLFEVARKAAESNQPDVMIEALTVSGFLDGLVRRLNKKWDALPQYEIQECVAQAVDSAYVTISNRRRVMDLGGWLWKTASNKASDRWHKDYAKRTWNDIGVEDVPGVDHVSASERARLDELQDRKRGEAIRHARELLPRIGQGQIISVMELMIDAVEQDVPHLSPTEIGAALGITADAARTLLDRGYSRLRREARREGIEFLDDLADNDQDDNASFPQPPSEPEIDNHAE